MRTASSLLSFGDKPETKRPWTCVLTDPLPVMMQQKDGGGIAGGSLLRYFSSMSRTKWRLICLLLCLLMSQQGNFMLWAVQTGTLMNAKFAFLCKIPSLYYF